MTQFLLGSSTAISGRLSAYTSFRRPYLAWLTAFLFSTAGCSSERRDEERSLRAKTEAVSSNPSTLAPFSLAAKAERSRKVWCGGSIQKRERTVAAERTAVLEVTELRQDDLYLYLQTHHEAIERSEGPTRLATPTALLLVDGYPAKPPSVLGSVVYDRVTPTWLQIPLSDLPDGELDLTLLTLGTENTVPILKKEGQVAYMTDDMRRGYKLDSHGEGLIRSVYDRVVEVGP